MDYGELARLTGVFIRSCIGSKETAGLCQMVCGAFLCGYPEGETGRRILDATIQHRIEQSLARPLHLVGPSGPNVLTITPPPGFTARAT